MQLINEQKVIDRTKFLLKNYYQKPVKLESDRSAIQYAWGILKILESDSPCKMWAIVELIRNDFDRYFCAENFIKYFPQGLSEDIKAFLSENKIEIDDFCNTYSKYNRENLFERIKQEFKDVTLEKIVHELTGVQKVNPQAEENIIKWLTDAGASEQEIKGIPFSPATVKKFFNPVPQIMPDVNDLIKAGLGKAKSIINQYKQNRTFSHGGTKRANSLSFLLNSYVDIGLKCLAVHAMINPQTSEKAGTTLKEKLSNGIPENEINEIVKAGLAFAREYKIDDWLAFQNNLLDNLVDKPTFFGTSSITSEVVAECLKPKTSMWSFK